jgi:ubiquinone/menaquinone biosynthesis C-methylase UbiE
MSKNRRINYLLSESLEKHIQFTMKYDSKKVIFEKWKESILELYGFSNMKSLIDIGCGTGNFLIQVRKNFPDCILKGIDSYPEMIETASSKAEKQNANNIDFKVTDIKKFISKSTNEKYDVVSACHILYYFDDIPDLIKQMKQNILDKDGVFFVTTNSMNDMPELYLLLRKVERKFNLEYKCGELNSKFGLENGYEMLKRLFKYVDYHSIESELIIVDEDEIMDYIVSRYKVVMRHLPEELYNDASDFLQNYINDTIAKKGVFIFTRKVGALVCSD